MRTLSGILAAMVLMAMVGCQSVDSTAILGEPSEKVAKAVEGVWQLNDAVFYAKALGHDGQIDLASVQRKDNQWQMQTFTMIATTLDGKSYLNLQSTANEPKTANSPKTYYFLRVLYDAGTTSKPGRYMVVFSPDVKVFAQAVRDGKLPGEVVLDKKSQAPSNVHLSASAEALAEFVKTGDGQKLFDVEHPQVLTRLK